MREARRLWKRADATPLPLLGAIGVVTDDEVAGKATESFTCQCCKSAVSRWRQCFDHASSFNSMRAEAAPLPEAAQMFLGQWKMERKENLDAFLQARALWQPGWFAHAPNVAATTCTQVFGLGWPIRKVAAAASPRTHWHISNDDVLRVRIEIPGAKTVTRAFEMGVLFFEGAL